MLIANFDWPVEQLIKPLHAQLLKAKLPFEVLCYDNSKNSIHESENNKLNALRDVTYALNHTHIGRSQNRNKLARDAQYENLLFLDGDSEIIDLNFIANYLESAVNHKVVCGGTAYGAKPTDPNKLLRWQYGKAREERSAENRNQNPNNSFSSFNFLIKKEAFELVYFNNELTKYGHEDTLFGLDLKAQGYRVQHINNPLIHLGLDYSELFLEKTRTAIKNLNYLIDGGYVGRDIKIVKWYLAISRAGLKPAVKKLYNFYRKTWENNLCGTNPNLRIFDFYKLGVLCNISHATPHNIER